MFQDYEIEQNNPGNTGISYLVSNYISYKLKTKHELIYILYFKVLLFFGGAFCFVHAFSF